MSSFQASSFTATDGVDSFPLDDVALGSQSKDPDDDENEDEVSSPPSLSASPTRYDMFKPIPYQDDLCKIQKLVNRGCQTNHLYKLTGLVPGEVPRRAGPVLQVLSVTLYNEIYPLWESEISGEISITDGQSNTFYIYKCEEDDPEFVSDESEWNRLDLKGCPITPIGEKVNFRLKHNTGKLFLEGNCDVDFSINDAYPGKHKMQCSGKDGFYAVMEYTIIPFALVAEVSVMMNDKNKDRVGEFYIYGTIKVNDLVLFEEPASDPACMKHGTRDPFVQLTHKFAVPIHSPLALEIKLCSDHRVFADAKFQISPYGLQPLAFTSYCNDGSHYLCVHVVWVLYEDYFLRGSIRWKDNVNVKWNPTPPPWLDLVVYLEPPPEENSKRALVEVFSVFVGGKSSDRLDLYGKIVVRDLDQDKTVFIFARDSEIPDELTDGQSRTVSLAWPGRWFVEEDFFLFLNLKDNNGDCVCRGYLSWDPQLDAIEAYYDRRLCDIIRGANGYFAAVHYSVFKNGKKARVTVTWEGDDTVVYGSVYAAYSNHKYPSTYDKEYYQSIIFKRSVNDGVSVEKYSEIPLSKSHVSAPSDCKGLRVDVKLYYERTRCHCPTFEFKADETEVKSSECISVKVEWFVVL